MLSERMIAGRDGATSEAEVHTSIAADDQPVGCINCNQDDEVAVEEEPQQTQRDAVNGGNGVQPPLLTLSEKLRMQSKLLPYVLPLIIVYWAEHAIQSGAWTVFAIGGPITEKSARTRSYQILNLFYQIGVLISRSAGSFSHSHYGSYGLAHGRRL